MRPSQSIVIEADIDESRLLDECARYRRHPAPTVSLLWFRFPVRLQIGGVELLDDTDKARLRLSVVHVAANLTLATLVAAELGTASFDLSEAGDPQPLEILAAGDGRVVVSRPSQGISVTASLDELLASLRQFADSIRGTLLANCPELADNLVWHAWFAGDETNGRTIG